MCFMCRVARKKGWEKSLLSYLAFSQIWLNLPMDYCQFGYISKLTWYSIIHGFLLIFRITLYGHPWTIPNIFSSITSSFSSITSSFSSLTISKKI